MERGSSTRCHGNQRASEGRLTRRRANACVQWDPAGPPGDERRKTGGDRSVGGDGWDRWVQCAVTLGVFHHFPQSRPEPGGENASAHPLTGRFQYSGLNRLGFCPLIPLLGTTLAAQRQPRGQRRENKHSIHLFGETKSINAKVQLLRANSNLLWNLGHFGLSHLHLHELETDRSAS